MTKQEILDRIDAISRPTPRFRSLRDVHLSMREIAEWDARNADAKAEWVALAAQLERIERQEAEQERSLKLAQRMLLALERSGAGERALGVAAIANPTEAIDATKLWLHESPPRWALVLRGDVGTGKSVAACYALRDAAKQGETVMFRRAGEVVRLSGFDAGAEELARLKRAGLLVLEDVAPENLTDWGRGLLAELLDVRYEARARTVLTANPSWPVLVERLGQRIVDRLRHGGRVVELRGKSMRGAA